MQPKRMNSSFWTFQFAIGRLRCFEDVKSYNSNHQNYTLFIFDLIYNKLIAQIPTLINSWFCRFTYICIIEHFRGRNCYKLRCNLKKKIKICLYRLECAHIYTHLRCMIFIFVSNMSVAMWSNFQKHKTQPIFIEK